jgi:hypothetical protein
MCVCVQLLRMRCSVYVCVYVSVWNASVYYVHNLCVPVCARTDTLYLSPYVRMLSATNVMRA